MSEQPQPFATLPHARREINLTAIIQRDLDTAQYSAVCPELDVASQGNTVELARENLAEAVQLFFELASSTEIARRSFGAVYISSIHATLPAHA